MAARNCQPTFVQRPDTTTTPQYFSRGDTTLQCGKGGNVTSAGWQVTLCDPMWHVSSRSGVATLRTAIHLLLTYFSASTLLVGRHSSSTLRPTPACSSHEARLTTDKHDADADRGAVPRRPRSHRSRPSHLYRPHSNTSTAPPISAPLRIPDPNFVYLYFTKSW